MTPEFEEISTAAHRPASGSWSEWIAQLDRRPVSLTFWTGPDVFGHPSRLRLGGIFVEPVESVVSLRAFADSMEGTVDLAGLDDPVPFAIYDLEKIARMLLHDSGTALEILGSPVAVDWEHNRPELGREIVRRGLTAGSVVHYCEVARPVVEALTEGEKLSESKLLAGFRRLLTGVGLLDGQVRFHLPTMAERGDVEPVTELLERDGVPEPGSRLYGRLAETAAELSEALEDPEGGCLSREAIDYDGLDELVVDQRLDAEAES